jgi:hypothetical protein
MINPSTNFTQTVKFLTFLRENASSILYWNTNDPGVSADRVFT